MQSYRSPLVAAAVFTLAAAVPAFAQSPVAPTAAEPPRITVTGTGEANAAPDLALTQFTVLRTAKTAREALDAANAAMAEVTAAMKDLGIEARDLQTSGFTISPQYRYEEPKNGVQNPPEIVGYEVRNTLALRVRKIGDIGAVLDKAVTLGVNQGGDISFDIDDPAALRSKARTAAVTDAKETARILAEAAGVKLGKIIEINDEADMPMPVPMAARSMKMEAQMADAVPVEAGESTINARVRVVFEIAD
ncbi:SIMPL domain-containing protein [Mangrovicella endophytica]|uniref:SIMPL domain-containing protein n=1 Tax=Mangrovicella endophytica TaxID=2066697 RepID=UPI000C9DC770|nr:SIMPL domain-containing protein [Mangrovicella endophytica]